MTATGPDMKFGILGPLEVTSEPGPVAISGKRRRAILVRLLCAPNTAVDIGRICEDVWGATPPAGAASTLHSHLSYLRGLIGAHRIRASGGSVVLTVEPGELDVPSFEAELSQAIDLLRSADPGQAAAVLDVALSRWRGSALADVADAGWALPEIARLDELQTLARETRLEAHLQLGRHRDVIAPAERLLTDHPFRERIAGQLMLALYRSGRQAEALRVFQRVRRTLGDELGIEPGPELVALEESIVLGRPELDVPGVAVGVGVGVVGKNGAATVTGADPLPLPSRLATLPTFGLVGRDDELELVSAAFKRVANGDGREVVLVSGELGLGKTTLVAAGAREAHHEGALVLFGRSEEDLSRPYGLFAEALGRYVDHAPIGLLAEHIARHGGHLARIVPTLADRVDVAGAFAAEASGGIGSGGAGGGDGTDAESERYQLFAAIVGLLEQAAAERPVVLVLDDVQWADQSSLRVFRHIVESTGSEQLLVLATFRDNELSRAHPVVELLAALHRQSDVTRLELAGLDETGVESFVEAAAGQRLGDDGTALARAVHRETDGNPFFVTEVLHHLSESGAIYEDRGEWHIDSSVLAHLPLPGSVRTVIGARIGRLGDTAERLLTLASVMGREFDLDVLVASSGLSEDEVIDELDRACDAALVGEVTDRAELGTYSFVHALIQHTLYDEMGAGRRARAHLEVASTLESLFGEEPGDRLGELAHQWTAASRDAASLAKAIDYSRRAGHAALAALAPGDALAHYRSALQLCERQTERDPLLEIDLAIGLGTAQRQSGDPGFRETLLDAARQAAARNEPERLVAAALANDRGSGIGTIDVDKVEVLEMALEAVRPGHIDRALLLATLSQELIFGSPFERCQELADEALAIATASGDASVLVRVLNRGSFLAPPLLDTSMERTAEAMRLADDLGDPVQRFWAAGRRHMASVVAGDIEEADRCLEICGELVRRLGQPTLEWAYTGDLCTRELIRGNTARAESLATRAFEIATNAGEPHPELWFGAHMMTVSWQRGTLGDLVPLIEEQAAEYPAFAVFGAALTHGLADGERLAEAGHNLDEFAAGGYELPMDGLWLTGMTSYAEAAIACDLPEHAGALLDAMAPWADRISMMEGTVGGPVSRLCGGLAITAERYEEAEAYLEAAAATCERIGAAFFSAYTKLLRGRLATRRGGRGSRQKADAHFEAAAALAASGGYARIGQLATERR